MRFFFFVILAIFSDRVLAQHWDSLAGGVNRPPDLLYADSASNKLYVAGTFTKADHETVWGIASWNGNRWDSLGHGIDDPSLGNMPANTWNITPFGNYLYVGGSFSRAGNLNTPALARWNGNAWDSIPGGPPNGVVKGIMALGSELYICGGFSGIGLTSINNIAKWNGTSWQSVGNYNNWNGLLTKMIFFHGNLYVAGTFDDPNGNFCRLAKWDGLNWQFFTADLVGGLAGIWDMEVYNNELFIGGLFYASDGNAATSIMRWNDTAWSAVGGSIQIGPNNPFPTIKDMCVHNGRLYCAGNFERIGGITANGIASWDGTNWCSIDMAFSGLIYNLAFYKDTLYVSGGFVQMDNDTAWYIAKWVGGNYTDTCGVISTGFSENIPENNFSLYPNPSSGILHLDGNFSGNEPITLEILDWQGKLIYSETILSAAIEEKEINLENESSGLYLLRIITSEKIICRKIMLE